MFWRLSLLLVLQAKTFSGATEQKTLILTPLIKSNLTAEAKNLSKVVFDGFEDISENEYLEDPVILWLHGGPGLPSECGLFGESGPITVSNGTLLMRDNSWTKNHSMLYIDNPVGTGFSFTDDDEGYATDQEQIGQELYKALIQFFILFPELKRNDFYLAGGSYAGKYIPSVGHFIHENNPNSNSPINLQGILLYSPLVDPVNQVVYADFLFKKNLVNVETKNKLNYLEELIIKYINKDQYFTSTLLYSILINEIQENPKVANIYNYLNNHEYYNIIPDWIPYVIQPEIRQKLHVGDTAFNFNISNREYKVRNYLGEDWTKSVAPWFEELVNHYRCLVFTGDLDVMSPYNSVAHFISKLNFSASNEFKNEESRLWRVDEQIAGYCKTAGYLTECVVKDAGHSVPYEKPKIISDLVYKFIKNISIYDDDIDNSINNNSI